MKQILTFNEHVFEVKDILEYYDRALTFICIKYDSKELYLFDEFECSSEYTGWIAVRISMSLYEKLKKNIVSANEVLLKLKNKEHFIFKEYDNKIEVEIRR